MSDILSYGFSFPKYQVEEKTLSPKFGKKGKRTVTYIDEDIITLAFDAAHKCMEKTNEVIIDGVFFATTSPVFEKRYHASFLADLTQLPSGILALDFGSTPKAGTDALFLANNIIDSGANKNILVIAVDVAFAEVGREANNSIGHAAVAVLLSNNAGLAKIKVAKSLSSSYSGEFNYKGSKISYDPRFSRETGFIKDMKQVLDNLETPVTNFDSVILNTQYAKIGGGLFLSKGFSENQFAKDNLSFHTGNTGCCHALLQVIDTIESRKKNILLTDYFNGTNIFEIGVTESVFEKTLQFNLVEKKAIVTYQDYLLLKKAGDFHSPEYHPIDLFTSEMMNEREKDEVLYLTGNECTSCNTVYLIKSLRCKNCGCDKFGKRKLKHEGTIYALTHEYYFPASFAPVIMAVIDLDGGGRTTVQITDDMYAEDKNKIQIGSRVKLVLRKMMENGIKPGYFWKAKLL